MQASLSILRKNLAQPFSLTLLNIGATSFLASAPAQRVVPKALRSFLRAGQGSSRHKSTSSQQVAGHAGALHSILKRYVPVSTRRLTEESIKYSY